MLPFFVPIILFCLLLFLGFAVAGVILLSVALRYRAGTARRRGRRWLLTLNVWITSLSAAFFFVVILVLSFWFPRIFPFALGGVVIGAGLGLLGLVLTRWETKGEEFFYTPSRWLALLITVVIVSRFFYVWFQSKHHAGNTPGAQHWLLSGPGMHLSFAVAAGFIGYYLIYAIGVRFRLLRHERSRLAQR